jgi:host cell surface-exposed lipoprotein
MLLLDTASWRSKHCTTCGTTSNLVEIGGIMGTGWKVLLGVLFPPLGIYWLLTAQSIGRTAKIAIGSVAGLLLLLIIVAAATSGGGGSTNAASTTTTAKESTTTNQAATTTTAAPPTTAAATTSPPPAPKMTVAQQQAVASARSYLSLGSGFSRAGLINQLSSSSGEGFSKADAAFAVDSLNVNWNEQAVESAKGYMSLGSGFSRAGLIEQLSSSSGEGFTHAQAVYAANKVGL